MGCHPGARGGFKIKHAKPSPRSSLSQLRLVLPRILGYSVNVYIHSLTYVLQKQRSQDPVITQAPWSPAQHPAKADTCSGTHMPTSQSRAQTSSKCLETLLADGHRVGLGECVRDDLHDALHDLRREMRAQAGAALQESSAPTGSGA